MKLNILLFKKIYRSNNTLILPQRYFRSLVKPIVDQLRWEDTGDHLQRWDNLFFPSHVIDAFKE